MVANGGTIYNGLVQTVRKSADYDVLTAEALEAVLNMFGRAKTKAAFRDRSAELAHRMVAEGLTIWEDLRGVDLAWLEKTVGVPHFEAHGGPLLVAARCSWPMSKIPRGQAP